MVYANAQGHATAATKVEQGHETRAEAFEFGGIFLVGKFKFHECASRIYKVARINSHFLNTFGGGKGCGRIEMYVGHKRGEATGLAHPGADVFEIAGVLGGLSCESDYVGAGACQAQYLIY